MTSFAFIMGTVPLAIASGAGARDGASSADGDRRHGSRNCARDLPDPAMFAVVERLSARLSRRSAPHQTVAKVPGDGDAH